MTGRKVLFKNENGMGKLYSTTSLSPSTKLSYKILRDNKKDYPLKFLVEVKMYLFTINISDELASFHEVDRENCFKANPVRKSISREKVYACCLGRYNLQHRPILGRKDKNVNINHCEDILFSQHNLPK